MKEPAGGGRSGRRRSEISAVAQVALSAVPIVGPVVSQAIALYGTERRNELVDGLIDDLARQIALGHPADFDQEYVRQGDFQDAVFRALDAARVTSNAEKRRTLVAALVGAMSRTRPAGLDVEGVIDALGGLTAFDLRLAREVWIEAGAGASMSIATAVTGPANFPDREFHLARLAGAGLIVSTAGQWDRGGQFQLTGTFHRLMALLEAGGIDTRSRTERET